MGRKTIINDLTEEEKAERYNKVLAQRAKYARDYFLKKRAEDPTYKRRELNDNAKKYYKENKELQLIGMKERYIDKKLKLIEERETVLKQIEIENLQKQLATEQIKNETYRLAPL